MIKFINVEYTIIDPIDIDKAPAAYGIRQKFVSSHFVFNVPENIVDNKGKKEYYAGFLNEMYSLIYPEKSKSVVFKEVCKLFNIFIEERQYQNLIYGYKKNKYTHFIKN